MRPCRVPWLFALAFVLPAGARADDFSDFRIPDHRLSAFAFGVGAFGDRRSDVVPDVSHRSSDWNADANAQASWRSDSDPREWDLSFFGRGRGSWNRDVIDGFSNAGSGTSFASLDDHRGANSVESWSATAGGRLYPGSGRIGLGVRGTVAGNETQGWTTFTSAIENVISGLDQRSESQSHQVGWEYQEFANLDLMAGFGRVRDATPVFDAILLEERLSRDHALVRPLGRAALQKLADLFALRGAFTIVHDFSDKFFWSEVERILGEDGALPEGGLHAYALRHADDPLVVASRFPRDAGFFVGPVISARHTHTLQRFDETDGERFFSDGTLIAESIGHFASRLRESVDQTFFGVGAEYHRPIGDRTQLDLFERGLVDFRGDPDALDVEGNLSIARLVGERWFFSAGADHQRTLQNQPRSFDSASWTVGLNGTIGWYVEDFLRLDLGLRDVQIHQRPGNLFLFFPPPPTPTRQVSKDFQASLRITFARGSLSAPGLGVTQRSLR